jgi:hypothetical protein
MDRDRLAPAPLRRRGRPTKYTVDRIEQIEYALATGQTKRAAAATAGIGHSAFYEWLRVDPEFAERVEQAIRLCERAYVERIRLAAVEGKTTRWYGAGGELVLERREFDWQAAAWLLEHHPEHRWESPHVSRMRAKDC